MKNKGRSTFGPAQSFMSNIVNDFKPLTTKEDLERGYSDITKPMPDVEEMALARDKYKNNVDKFGGKKALQMQYALEEKTERDFLKNNPGYYDVKKPLITTQTMDNFQENYEKKLLEDAKVTGVENASIVINENANNVQGIKSIEEFARLQAQNVDENKYVGPPKVISRSRL